MERATPVATSNHYAEQLSSQRSGQQMELTSSQLGRLHLTSSLDLIIAGLLVGLILISIVGNCLVCVAIFTDRRLRKLGNAFIVSLAIADLFVSCLVMTFALCNDMMNHWIFGERFCDVWISFDIMCCTASILNLCAISLDRFVHIKDCLLYNQWMTRKVAISAVIIIWFISALVSFVPINLGWHKPPEFANIPPADLNRLQSVDARLAAAATSASFSQIWPGQSGGGFGGIRASKRMRRRRSANTSNLPSTPPSSDHQRLLVKLLDGRRGQLESAKLNYNSTVAAAALAAIPTGAKRAAENQSDDVALRRQTASIVPGRPPADGAAQIRQQEEEEGGRSSRSANRRPPDSDYAADRTQEEEEERQETGSSGKLVELNKLGQTPNGSSSFSSSSFDDNNNNNNNGPGEQSNMNRANFLEPQQAVNLAAAAAAVAANELADSNKSQPADLPDAPQCMLSLTPTYAIISSTISFYIPCLIMLGLYTKLFACARRHVRNIQAISKAPVPIALLAGPTLAGSSSLDSANNTSLPPPESCHSSRSLPGGCSEEIRKRATSSSPLAALPFGRGTTLPLPLKTWLKFKRTRAKSANSRTATAREQTPDAAQSRDDDNQLAKDANPANQRANEATLAGHHHAYGDLSGINCTSCHGRPSGQSPTADTEADRPACRPSNTCKRCQSSLSSRTLLANISSGADEDADAAARHPLNDDAAAVVIEKSTAAPEAGGPKLLQNASDNQTKEAPGGAKQAAAHPPDDSEERHPFLGEPSDNNNNFYSNEQRVSSCNLNQVKTCDAAAANNNVRAVKINFAPSQQQQQQQQQHQQQQQQSGQLATHKAAITLGIIMGTFLFCWVPFFCLNIIKAFCVDCIPGSVFRAFTWLGYANSALNPIIYGIHNSEFRNAFNRIFFKHLNIKNSRYYLNRRSSYDLRHANHRLNHQRGRFRKNFTHTDSKQSFKSDTLN